MMTDLLMTFGSLGALGLITAIGRTVFTGGSSTAGADGASVPAGNGARNTHRPARHVTAPAW